MKTTTSNYRVEYIFNHSQMGFSNSVTVNAINTEQAITKAEDEVRYVYGSSMFKRFRFKTPIKLT